MLSHHVNDCSADGERVLMDCAHVTITTPSAACQVEAARSELIATAPALGLTVTVATVTVAVTKDC
jgi:hypothetical protein